MRAIKVTYRAVFLQPKGMLNPMGCKLPGPYPVEIFPSAGQWKVREIASTRRVVYEKLGRFPSLGSAQAAVSEVFESISQNWQVWGIPPAFGPQRDQIGVERLLMPEEVCDLGDGKMLWYEDEDRTHIIHAQSIPDGARVPPAACGAQVPAKCFISTKANLEPSCKGCAEVWRREYQNK